jgi:peptidoglycan/xylan/chitin deacetylase (PgdA/CDA1 family)
MKFLKYSGFFILILIIGFFYIKTLPVDKKELSQLAIPSPTPTPHTDFKEIRKVDPSKNEIVITIDAGQGERSADGILKAFSKHKLRSTFFLVGKWLEAHPLITKRIAREGHEIFNHSYSHADFTTLTAEEIKAELQKMDDALFKVAGVRTRPYFRAPFGYRNAEVNAAAAEAGFQHIYWSIDSIDWREGETGETIKKRVLDNLHPGAIVLMHIDDIPTGDIMDELLTEIEQRGYKLVSLTEALK